MVKLQNHKFIGVITVLMMLTSSHLTINYAYAEEFGIEEVPKSGRPLMTIVAEMVKDGKLAVRVFQISPSMTPLEIDQTLSKEGSVVGWALMKGESTKSGIVLYNGKTIQTEAKIWQITDQGISQTQSETTKSDENSAENQKEIEYRVIFEVEEEPHPFSYLIAESSESPNLESREEFSNVSHELNPEILADSIPISV